MKHRLAVVAALFAGILTNPRPCPALDLAFERTWGGPATESGEAVAVATDGSVYVVGHTSSFGTGVADGDLDLFLLKYAADGTLLWQRTYGVGRPEPFRTANEFAMDVAVAGDGTVHATGELGGQVVLVRFDPAGNLLSETTWGEGGESPRGLAIAADGSIYVTGFTFTFSVGQGDAFLLKFASDGTTLLWQKTWGGLGFDIADDVAAAADGAVYVAGDTNSFFANDAFLVKFTSAGDVVWERAWRDGTIQDMSAAHGVAVGADGSVYLTGRASLEGVGQNAFLVKFTPDGTAEWERTWGDRVDTALDIAVGPDGTVYLTGNTGFGQGSGDVFVVQFLPTGRARQAGSWGSLENESGQAIAVGADGSIYVAATTSGPPPYRFRKAPKTAKAPDAFLGDPAGTVTMPAGTRTDPNGTLLTPAGSQTYAGGTEAVLLKIVP
jgi:uncharacterized delta-60 repeat protein